VRSLLEVAIDASAYRAVAASGIAWEGGAAARVQEPRPLPARALDQGSGWLAALGTIAPLLARLDAGGFRAVEVSLARTARRLDGSIDGEEPRCVGVSHRPGQDAAAR
jgi:hypothetical protein